MTRLAIVPARGGSKRIHKKNIRDFHGVPMITHVLRTAKASGLFDEIHISTEDPEILEIAAKFHEKPKFIRPQELACDHTPLLPVLKNVLTEFENLGITFDEVWMIMPCAPLIDVEDFNRAAIEYSKLDFPSPLAAIAEYSAPIEWAFEKDENNKLKPLHPGAFRERSQDLRPKYYETGTFIVYPYEYLKHCDGSEVDQDYVGIEIDRHKAIDIDDENDWLIAEALFEYFNNKRKHPQ